MEVIRDRELHEECGVFGIYGVPNAASLTYYGLHALQHRGQEGAGIVSVDESGTFRRIKGGGLVTEVFDEAKLATLKGSTAIGHVRYTTAGGGGMENVQPFLFRHNTGDFALAHNGNIVNSELLRRHLENKGSLFQSTSDSEILAHLIKKETRYHDRPRIFSIIDALNMLEGAFAFLIMTANRIYACRDKYGLRPLSIGKLGDGWVVSSETCAFDVLGAEFVRDVEPGEIVTIDKQGIRSRDYSMRTPLTAIKGWAETLQTGGIGRETYDKGMNVIVREAERLSGMVEELLDFSRMQSGRMRLILKKIDLLAELDEAVYMFTDRARTEHKNLIYDEEDTMLSPILGDVNRLRQVFINVIDNALKYTNPGGTVRVSAYEDDGFIRVIIKDSGCGIPAEHLPNVKKKFYKANQNVRGNGIGLAVANEIMELHSGSLDVDSEEGMGTTVIITIPTMKKLEMNPELSNTTQIPTATAQVQVVERKQD